MLLLLLLLLLFLLLFLFVFSRVRQGGGRVRVRASLLPLVITPPRDCACPCACARVRVWGGGGGTVLRAGLCNTHPLYIYNTPQHTTPHPSRCCPVVPPPSYPRRVRAHGHHGRRQLPRAARAAARARAVPPGVVRTALCARWAARAAAHLPARPRICVPRDAKGVTRPGVHSLPAGSLGSVGRRQWGGGPCALLWQLCGGAVHSPRVIAAYACSTIIVQQARRGV